MAQRIAKIWIDTDGGVDDVLALACAYRDPGLSLSGISTVYGNVAPRKAARNAALVQRLAQADLCPILVGADGPSEGHWSHARQIHGEDGVGGASAEHRLDYEDHVVTESGLDGAAEAMARFARRIGPGGAIIALGPLTNLAHALQQAPQDFAKLGAIIVMGGSMSVPWVRRNGQEFNFGSDLRAARHVLEQARNLTIMPLDACRHVVLRRARLAQMLRSSPDRLGQFLRRAHQHYMDAYKANEGIDGCYPHDGLAVAALAKPDLMRFETLPLMLDDQGSFPGRLIISDAGNSIRIARAIDQRRALNWIEACLNGCSQD
ncbi:MAG: hypothetical protein GYB36_13530 [Alphaproteobacteria bacterium]|nr:hypothetical protein [Alphaproteobacteria bacterium]